MNKRGLAKTIAEEGLTPTRLAEVINQIADAAPTGASSDSGSSPLALDGAEKSAKVLSQALKRKKLNL